MNTKEKAVQAQAEIILGNEVFKEVLNDLEASLVKEWKISETTETRESCWLKVDALRSITEDLKALIHNDKIEN
jgi:hypothetical protein